MFESIIVRQRHKVVAVHCHPHVFVGVVEQCCTVFASFGSLPPFHRSVKLPDVRRILSSMHALDQSANFVFTIFLTILCSKSDVCECLGCSLEMCSADVVVSKLRWFSFPSPTHRRHDCDQRFHSLKWWHCREQLRGKEGCLKLALLFVLYSLAHQFSCERCPQSCLCPTRSTPTLSCLHLYTLASRQFR